MTAPEIELMFTSTLKKYNALNLEMTDWEKNKHNDLYNYFQKFNRLSEAQIKMYKHISKRVSNTNNIAERSPESPELKMAKDMVSRGNQALRENQTKPAQYWQDMFMAAVVIIKSS